MWTFSHLCACMRAHACVCVSPLPPAPPGYRPGKGGWGPLRVAAVHAARMIRPPHTVKDPTYVGSLIQYLISTFREVLYTPERPSKLRRNCS